MAERLDHVNIVVKDLERMTRFYRRALGLNVAKRVAIRGPWLEAITGLPGAEADVVYLEAAEGGPEGAGVELIRYARPEGGRPAGLERANAGGIRHVAFRVPDIERAAAAVQAEGGRPLSQIQDVPAEQVDFGGRRKRILYCLDPEENLVELCEFG